MSGVSIYAKFYVAILDGDSVVNYIETTNKILKPGLMHIAEGKGIGRLSLISIGSDDSPTVFTQTGLNSPLLNNTGDYANNIDGLSEYSYGFVNYFPVGRATGEWKEIGVRLGTNNALFNRAIINSGEPVIKGPFQTAFAGVIFNVDWVNYDEY